MTVYFIGAGPGDPDLLTIRGRRLIERCPVCLYAGSLVPPEVVACAPRHALVRDTAPMHLKEIMSLIYRAHADDKDVARVHSGDPSIYGAIAEQIRRLRERQIAYEIIPGVPSFAAAAAAMGQELTIPGASQTIILTRTSMKSTAMPERETLGSLGRTGALLAIHLSVRNSREIQRQLMPHYGPNCPAAIAYRIGWPDQLIIRTTLAQLRNRIREHKLTRTALILVGRSLDPKDFPDSALYEESRPHILRPFAGRRHPTGSERKSGGQRNR